MDLLLIARFVQSSAAVVLAGTLLLRLLSRGANPRGMPRWNRLAWGCWGTSVLAGSSVLWLTAAAMTGQSLPDALRDHSIREVLTGTRFGAAWLVRAGLLAGVCAVSFLVGLRRWQGRPRLLALLDAANLLLAAAALAALVWTSHAQASAHRAWLFPADILHVLAAGAWPGGLLPLAILLVRTRREPALLGATTTITRRFSRMSAVAVAVLAFSGLVNACGMIGALAFLPSSQYGRALLCKVALFLVMVGVGFINRRLVKPDPSVTAAEAVRRLCLNVGWECVFAVGVLLATQALAMSAPPHG